MSAKATFAGEVIGEPLSQSDLDGLAQSWIPQTLAELACIRRVTHAQGAELFDNKWRRDLSGLLFPYCLPSEIAGLRLPVKGGQPADRRRNRKTRLQIREPFQHCEPALLCVWGESRRT